MRLIFITSTPRLALITLTAALAGGSTFAQTSVSEVNTVSSESNIVQQSQNTQVPVPTIPSSPVNAAPNTPNNSTPNNTATPTIVVPQDPSSLKTSPSASKSSPNTAKDPKAGLAITPLTESQQQTLAEAQASLQERKFAQARSQFEGLIVSNYNNPEPHFGLGLALYGLNDLAGSKFEFTQFTMMSPDRYEGPYNLGVIATREGRYADALKLYQMAADLIADQNVDTQVRLQLLQALAVEQARAKTYGPLADTYDQVLKVLPNNPQYLYRLAQARFLAQEYDVALPATYAVLKVEPANLPAALLLADIYAAQGLLDRAIRELDTATERASKSSDKAKLHFRRAELLAAKGLSRDALSAVRASSELDSGNIEAYALEGKLLNIREDRAGAIEAYRAALRLDLKRADYRTELAAIRLALGQNSAAANDALLAIRLKPKVAVLARAQYVLGIAQYRQQKYTDAKKNLTASQIAAPSADTALWLGMSYFALKDFSGAVGILSEALKLQGNNPEAPYRTAIRQNLAASLLALGRYDEAASLLAVLTSENEKNAEAWYLLGLTRKSMGNDIEAKQHFKRAAALGNARAKEAMK